uniref:Uncharacterized protein n=1 Tax=Rhizophora mucronata TaxID=61149 RepID=A0A2P2NC85_RHIMU
MFNKCFLSYKIISKMRVYV